MTKATSKTASPKKATVKVTSGPTTAESKAAVAEMAGGEFPQTRIIINQTRSKLIFPTVDVMVDPGKKKPAVFRDADHLKSFITDAEQLCFLNGSESAILIKTQEQDAEDEAAEAEAEAKAKATAAEESK